MDEETVARANGLADALGERGKSARKQLRCIVAAMGEDFLADVISATMRAIEVDAAESMRKDGVRRTLGGTFFRIARNMAHGQVDAKTWRRLFPYTVRRDAKKKAQRQEAAGV